jgi:hypothetical protein
LVAAHQRKVWPDQVGTAEISGSAVMGKGLLNHFSA